MYVTIENPAFCIALYLIVIHFRGELQHVGDVSEQKIKCRPIRTRTIGGARLSVELYAKIFRTLANLLRIVRIEMLKIANAHSDTRESKQAKLTVCQTLHSKHFLKVHKFVQERSQKLKGAGIQTSKKRTIYASRYTNADLKICLYLHLQIT